MGKPRLLAKLFTAFLSRATSASAKCLFASASASMVTELMKLHQVCKALQDSKSANLDSLIEEVSKAEHSVILHGFTALADCQPLLGLIGDERSTAQQLCRELYEQLTGFFLTF